MFLNVGVMSTCNLKCRFCYCKQDKPCDFKLIDDIPNQIVQYLKKNSITDTHFDIAIVGGEIFMDGLPDSVFDKYSNMISTLQHLLSEYQPGCTFTVHCYSNGVYNNVDRVIRFLTHWNSELVLSYDSVDRFVTTKQKQLMLDNLRRFVESQITVRPTVVIIKPQDISDQFINSEVFNRIYQLSGIDYQICMPNIYNVTAEQIADFFCRCLQKRLFRIENIRNLIHGVAYGKSDPACKRSLVYYENKTYIGCHYIKDDFRQIKYRVMDKHGCLYCQHMTYCPGLCWVYGDTSNGQCINKHVFDFIMSNTDIVDDYRQFCNKNINQ